MDLRSSVWLLIVLLSVPAVAQEQLEARGFVAHTYVKKTASRGFRFASPRLLTSELYDLVVRDRGRNLDYDPLCQCRDPDGLSAQVISVTGNRRQAVAQIILRYDGHARENRVTLLILRTTAGWKIADVGSARTRSLKTWLAHKQRAEGTLALP